MVTVGRFSWDGKTVTGPKEYMEDPNGFAKVKADLESGKNVLIHMAPIGTDTVTLMLVAIQTHYAGWLGMREMMARNKEARESQLAFAARIKARRA